MEKYHLDDLTDNAYVEMIGNIKQFVADAEPEFTEEDAGSIEELYRELFDDSAWNFMWVCIWGQL